MAVAEDGRADASGGLEMGGRAPVYVFQAGIEADAALVGRDLVADRHDIRCDLRRSGSQE